MIDFSKIPAPDCIDPLDYEGILAEIVADLKERIPAFSAIIESDPAMKLCEAFAYRETLLRARVNDAARACLLSSATGADLDNIAANYGVLRNGDEPDDSFRERAALTFEGKSTAGSVNAYKFYALQVAGVSNVTVTSPTPGVVHIHVLPTSDDVDAAPLCAKVSKACNAEDVRPLTDTVKVLPATRKPFNVSATLKIAGSLDSGIVKSNAETSLNEYLAKRRRLGTDVPVPAITAALLVEGVDDVEILSPAESIRCTASEAAQCTGITLSTEISAGNENTCND